jgi:hypothetical protein
MSFLNRSFRYKQPETSFSEVSQNIPREKLQEMQTKIQMDFDEKLRL